MILGEGRSRERNILDKRVAEAHRQPPPSSAAVLVRRAPSHLAAAVSINYFMRSKKKRGARHASWPWRAGGGRGASRRRGPRRERRGVSSERTLPLTGSRRPPRASAASHALRQRCGAIEAPRRWYPAKLVWARELAPAPVSATDCSGLWSARTHRQGRMTLRGSSYVSCFS